MSQPQPATHSQPDPRDALLPVYRRCDITMVRGEGCMLYDDAGRAYLDFASGIATNALGHNHPAMRAALDEQGAKLWHCSNLFRNQPLEAFAAALTNACFADQVFFCSSGTEAVESTIKTIRRAHYVDGNADRQEIIVMEGAFHGRSTGALAACSYAPSKQGFGELMPGFVPVPFHDAEALERAITNHTAAIMLETIQGEGGIRPHSVEYLQSVRRLCDAHGLLMVLDEIQCGYGRTGQLFAFEAAGITPDIVTSAKGIGGGFPLAAMLTTRHAARGMTQGMHGSTYGSNPLACAVGLAVLNELLADGFFPHVQKMGQALHASLTRITNSAPHLFASVRGVGLMQGLVLQPATDKYALSAALREAGLLVSPAVSPVIRVLPPLIVTEEHIAQAEAIMHHTIQSYSQ